MYAVWVIYGVSSSIKSADPALYSCMLAVPSPIIFITAAYIEMSAPESLKIACMSKKINHDNKYIYILTYKNLPF